MIKSPKFIGMMDGLEQFQDLSIGRSWNDDSKSSKYDEGVNIGQSIGLSLDRIKDTCKVLLSGGKIMPK